MYFFALCSLLIGIVEANQNKDEVELISDWQEVSSKALENNLPIILLVETSGCRFCKIVKEEFLNPLSNSEQYKGKVLFARISLDPGQSIINKDGHRTNTRDFCADYEALFTPTIIFLDGESKQLSTNLVGLSSVDYFAYYLEQGIENSFKALQSKESVAN